MKAARTWERVQEFQRKSNDTHLDILVLTAAGTTVQVTSRSPDTILTSAQKCYIRYTRYERIQQCIVAISRT